MSDMKVGVLSCSGEEMLGGTLARLATRKAMAGQYGENIVTLCLPLYVAGEGEERKFAQKYPVIAIDGCVKNCAKFSTIKYSNDVKDTIIISDLIGDAAHGKVISSRDLKQEHYDMIDVIAEAITKKVGEVLSENQ